MNLTSEQVSAVKHGEPVHIVVPDAGNVVVLRQDVYERLQALLDRETVFVSGEVVDEIMADDDANDPYLADFQRKYGNQQ